MTLDMLEVLKLWIEAGRYQIKRAGAWCYKFCSPDYVGNFFLYKLGCKLRRDDSVLPDKDHCKRKGKGSSQDFIQNKLRSLRAKTMSDI